MKPIRPRDAASLIPIRHRAGRLEILMGKRARAHRFLPDMYVFPGGRVDPADRDRRHSSALRPEVAARLAAHCNPRQARALAIAAARETYEETGLAIGELRDGMIVPALDRLDFILRAITPAHSPIRFHARFFAAQVGAADGVLRGNGELLDLAWRPVEECLRLPLADITEYLLDSLDQLLDSNVARRGAPLFAYRGARVEIRYPAGPTTVWARKPKT